ncbi:hypothetical protein [Anoxybacillus sp. UARK-01]|uniref:hypothetical protein n=1 Tax=Anoxybacillus sp. UARK-01 TaxID=1895648 RepID=UPI0011186155|nr:hypothetical protein [Anoxybacillus sp. UARK-01]
MALIEKVHSSLEELQELVNQTTDPLEREGLIAFINCVMVLCQENGHVKQREIAELRQLLFSD